MSGLFSTWTDRGPRLRAPAFGEDWCRIAPVCSPGPAAPTQRPTDSPGTAVPGCFSRRNQLRLTCGMAGHDRLEIQGQRAAESDWVLVAIDTNSAYLDARAPLVPNQPEQRRYRARFIDDDSPVGGWSAIVQVTAAP